MLKKNLSMLGTLLGIFLLLPFLAVHFAPEGTGMSICFLLFWAVDPVTCISTGWFSGRRPKLRWYFIPLPALLFLTGAWIFFEVDTAFLLYTLAYLLLTILATLITLPIMKWIRRSHPEAAPRPLEK